MRTVAMGAFQMTWDAGRTNCGSGLCLAGRRTWHCQLPVWLLLVWPLLGIGSGWALPSREAWGTASFVFGCSLRGHFRAWALVIKQGTQGAQNWQGTQRRTHKTRAANFARLGPAGKARSRHEIGPLSPCRKRPHTRPANFVRNVRVRSPSDETLVSVGAWTVDGGLQSSFFTPFEPDFLYIYEYGYACICM